MALLSKSDLQYKYSWSADAGDDPRKTGTPDNDLLDRTEGYEVLPFINNIAAELRLTRKADALAIEDKIHEIDTKIRSRKKIRELIIEWWNDR